MPFGYKYKSTSGFGARVPDVDGKGCIVNFIIVLVTVLIIAGLSYYFGWF